MHFKMKLLVIRGAVKITPLFLLRTKYIGLDQPDFLVQQSSPNIVYALTCYYFMIP